MSPTDPIQAAHEAKHGPRSCVRAEPFSAGWTSSQGCLFVTSQTSEVRQVGVAGGRGISERDCTQARRGDGVN